VSEDEKLRVPHWIEHNAEHAAEFRRWMRVAGAAAPELETAAARMESANRALAKALSKLGGPAAGHE
jgi:hypothetical protein